MKGGGSGVGLGGVAGVAKSFPFLASSLMSLSRADMSPTEEGAVTNSEDVIRRYMCHRKEDLGN
jgi:hypothetical protein